MLEALPGLYEDIYEARVIMQTEGIEIDEITSNLGDVLDQAIVDKATWGLVNWENFLGIQTDIVKPYDQRRSVIKSKIRGTGTVTVTLLKNVASSYENGAIEVTQQPSLYQFTVKFIDTLGAPTNLDDLKQAIEVIKPAHLAIVYLFRYLTISEVEVMTISVIENTTLDHFLGGGL